MKIVLNGEPHKLNQESHVTDLIEILQLGNQAIAVAINRKIIPKSLWSSTAINEHDVVDIVRAIGGG
jgi:sulfur carrier protein